MDIFILFQLQIKREKKLFFSSCGNKLVVLFAKHCRFERQQAILKDELAKIAQREKQLENEKTKASVQERQHTRQESEKTKQLVRTPSTHICCCIFHCSYAAEREIFDVLLILFKLTFSEGFCSFITEISFLLFYAPSVSSL